jgi:L-fuculose-phosphate aldolase
MTKQGAGKLDRKISLKNDIIEAGKRIYARGYVASNDGNISARLNGDRILITPTGISKGFMKSKELIEVDFSGNRLDGEGKPSSEIFMHLQIYRERPDVQSVCHAHPPYATGFAVAGIPLDKNVLPEVIIALGTIPLVEYGTPGTEEFSQPIMALLKDYDAFLLANHGALTLGNDVFNAYYKMETLEHFALIAFVARLMGGVKSLSEEQVKKLIAQREKFGIRKNIGVVENEDHSIHLNR